MNVRKTLNDLTAKISQLTPVDRVKGIILSGIEKDSNGDIVVASKSYIPFCAAGGKAWQETYPPGDPRRIKWESDQ